ncbi:MAG: hypothetical protein EZS28_013597, partial [Streblomastix strix]
EKGECIIGGEGRNSPCLSSSKRPNIRFRQETTLFRISNSFNMSQRSVRLIGTNKYGKNPCTQRLTRAPFGVQPNILINGTVSG